MKRPKLDKIGEWSKTKLEMIRKYAAAYSKILARYPDLYPVYIDGFAGAGLHLDRDTEEEIPGSPLNVIEVGEAFREFHLVELDPAKARHLKKLFVNRPEVKVYEGDCNVVLRDTLLPPIKYAERKRAFCLLDPYGLDLGWPVMELAGRLGTIDLLLNFPIMDMNMNALLKNPAAVKPDQAARLEAFWGDQSWRKISYKPARDLFGEFEEKQGNAAIVDAFRERLKTAAGFKHVPEALPMYGPAGNVIYFLIFASGNETAAKIMRDVFERTRETRGK